jgi:hypothetical protein
MIRIEIPDFGKRSTGFPSVTYGSIFAFFSKNSVRAHGTVWQGRESWIEGYASHVESELL